MQSLEWFMQPVDVYLADQGLALDKPIRELFKDSREYYDYQYEHRRIFPGQIVIKTTKIALTLFLITVPHSHQNFKYPTPITIKISEPLLDGKGE